MHLERIDGRFKLKENIGICTQSSVFQAVDLIKSDHTVLVKSRPRSSYYHDPCPLKHECAVLGDLRGLQGVPDIIWSGPSGMEYEHNVVVFEDLGPTLHDVFKSSGGSLPARTVATLAEQLIASLEHVHSRSYILTNISAQNILVAPLSPGQAVNKLFLFDFSLAQRYRDPQTYAHAPFRIGSPIPTALAFASINHHSGIQLSRRDDFEALAYVFIYLTRGSLPWIGHNITSNDDVLRMKKDIPISQLCDCLPSPFAIFLTYARDLSFTHKPDYRYIQSIFYPLRDDGLTLTAKVSERTYWREDLVSLCPPVAVTAVQTPRKRPHDATITPRTLRSSRRLKTH